MIDEPTALVRRGFDAIADAYLEWTSRVEGDPKIAYLELLASRLSPGARVLELGCGAGEPCTRLLAERFAVTGVDISEQQLSRARSFVPHVDYIRGDFTALELPPSSFGAVAAFYALNHVPRDRLEALFGRIHDWLEGDGLFLASLDVSDEEMWTGEWLGTTMYFSGWDAATNRQLLQQAGFELEIDELVTIREPEPDGEATFQWVLARR